VLMSGTVLDWPTVLAPDEAAWYGALLALAVCRERT
jgi:hypothetical protein